MTRLRIERNRDTTRREFRIAKKRKTVAQIPVVATGLGLLLAYQAITDIVEGSYVIGENYLGQPVGLGIQLLVLFVALFVGVVAAWQYLHPKPESKKEKKKTKPCCLKYSWERIP